MLSRWLSKKNAEPVAPAPMPARPTAVHEGERLRAFRAKALARTADGSMPPSVFRRLGDDTPPPTGAALAPWVNSAIDRALALPVTASIYALDHHLLTALSEHMAAAVASRYAWFGADDASVQQRLDEEAAILRDMSREDIASRFELTPPARIDPVPAVDVALRSWIVEMLRGEEAAIAVGYVSPTDVARIACRSRLPVAHARPDGGERIVTRFPSYQEDQIDARQRKTSAEHMSGISRDVVVRRFAPLAGFMEAMQTATDQPSWAALIERALTVEKVREVSGLSAAPSQEADIELGDVVLVPDTDGMGFEATLTVLGDRVCRLVGTGNGEMVADEWTEGCGPADLEALDDYIAATGDARDDGGSPDTLAMRLMDIVATHTLVQAYLLDSEGYALFGIEGLQGDALHREPILEGRTREEVVAEFKAGKPWALALDDLGVREAAELWASLSA